MDGFSTFRVVVNDEQQFSIWPVELEIPKGWRGLEKQGSKEECLAYIDEVWLDTVPASLRKKKTFKEVNGG